MNSAKRHEFFVRLARENPQPESELEYTSPFELLVAVILSAQATDSSVNKAMRHLFPIANTPRAIAAMGEERLGELIKTIGLYRTKAKNVAAMCAMLIASHDGEVPRSQAALEALPGVGRKTANVVRNNVFGDATLAVDTHVFRVANRTGLARGRNVLEVEMKLMKTVPPDFMQHAHHWLILHGRYVCKARVPECWRCVVRDLCAFTPKPAAPLGAVQ